MLTHTKRFNGFLAEIHGNFAEINVIKFLKKNKNKHKNDHFLKRKKIY